MPSQRSGIREGIAVAGKSEPELFSLVQQFQSSQQAFFQECKRQNSWARAWFVLAFALFSLVLGGGAVLAHRLRENRPEEPGWKGEMEEARGRLERELQDRLHACEERQGQEWDRLRQIQKEGRLDAVESYLRLSEQQQKAQKFYEERVLVLEKERIELLREREKARESWKDAELALNGANRRIQELESERAKLAKDLNESRRQAEHWRKMAGERFSPEQWRLLQQDKEDDN